MRAKIVLILLMVGLGLAVVYPVLAVDFLPLVPPPGCPGFGYTFHDLLQMLHNIFQFLASFLAPAMAVIGFLVAGFLFMAGSADAGAQTKARSALRLTIIGVLWVLLSWVVVNTIINVITNTDPSKIINDFPWNSPNVNCPQ